MDLELMIKQLAEAVKDLKDNTMTKKDFEEKHNGILEQIDKMSKEELKTFKSKVIEEQEEFLKDAKIEDVVGKAFIVSKDAKLGTNEYVDETTSKTLEENDILDKLTSVFGIENSSGNVKSHTYINTNASMVTVDGEPVDECAAAQSSALEYGKADFPIKKYATEQATSVEFNEFVNGGAEGIIKNIMNYLKNSVAKHSLTADSTKYCGMFNKANARKFVNGTVATAGEITLDDIISLRYKSKTSILSSGVFILPESAIEQLEKLKDSAKRPIFTPNYTMQTSIQNFKTIGMLYGRPVVTVRDDIWFKVGETITTASKAIIGFVSPDAFQYYKHPITKYQKFVQFVAGDNDIVIEVLQSTNAGCIDLRGYTFKGFGITDPNAGAYLANPSARQGTRRAAGVKEKPKKEEPKKEEPKKEDK